MNDDEENDWITDVSGLLDHLERAWIGFSDADEEGTWVWESGGSGAYTNWGEGKPNELDNDEDFAAIGPDGRWSDNPGAVLNPGIIECESVYLPTPELVTNGTVVLAASSFGQPCAPFLARTHFVSDTISTARSMLFRQDQTGGVGRLLDWSLTITSAQGPLDKSAPLEKTWHAEFWVSPLVRQVDNTAGTATFDVTVKKLDKKEFKWDAELIPSASGTWLRFDGDDNGTDSGSFKVKFGANTGGVRSQAIRVYTEEHNVDGSPAVVLVVQGAAENILTINPQSSVVATAGGSVTVNVANAGAGTMSWQAEISEGEFLTLSGANGTNNGSFTFNVPANPGLPRSATIFVNAAGAEGSPAVFRLFQQGIDSYTPAFGETPKDIPNPGMITSSVTVEDNVVVADVQVALDIEHTWDEDLEVSLRSPNGQEVLLFANVGGGADNFGQCVEGGSSLILRDSATISIGEGSPPFLGPHKPQGQLAAFSGENARGVWTLIIKDSLNNIDDPANPPAFRFIDEIYGNVNDTPINQLENRLLTETQIDQMLAEMFGDDELALVRSAETMVRDALRYAPFDKKLRNVLLDIAYYRCMANLLVAKEKLVRAYKRRIDVPLPGERVIDTEIRAFERAMEAYEDAATPYYELFTDGMGVDMPRFFPWTQTGNGDYPPFGYLVFVTEVPGRSLYAATFRDENDNPVPVLCSSKNEAAPLLTGYKDWAIMFNVLRDQAVAARELAMCYIMRGNPRNGATPGDIEKAKTLINETLSKMDIEGQILLGIFPDYDPDEMPADSGIPETIASWQNSIGELNGLKAFMDGNLNLLGFREDFLMLVQQFENTKDSFDALLNWNNVGDITSPLGAAKAKLDKARASYQTYRGSQDQLSADMAVQVKGYRERLAAITGVDPGPDPANPIHLAYLKPAENQGSEINLQVMSIQLAANRIQQNQQKIANLKQQVEIEVQRRAQEAGINANIQSIMIRYGNKQASLTKEIAHIQALQVRADNLAAAANCIQQGITYGSGGVHGTTQVSGGLVAFGVNAALQYKWEEDKGEIEAEKEVLAAMEQAEIRAQEDALLDINSKAAIKTWLLDMKTYQLQSQEAGLLLNQEVARLAGLLGEKATIEATMAELSQDLLNRYYADPTHRLRFQGDMLEAQKAFETAQRWVYFTLRAFEYKHNIAGFVTGDGYSLNSVFGARTADELIDIVNAVKAFDFELGLPGGIAKEDWLSFTEDILGYRKKDAAGNTLYYLDEQTGKLRTATQLFRNYLLEHQDASGVIVLDFSTVLDNGLSFFFGPRYAANGTLLSPGAFLDKINYMKINIPGSHSGAFTAVAGTLTQGGVQFIRNLEMGQPVPGKPNHYVGESTAWSTRFWYKHPGNPAANPPQPPGWRFNEGLTVNVVLNLVNSSRDTTPLNTFNEFAERSVAATGWRLVIYAKDGNQTKLRVNDCDDIEIYFNHRAKNRPF